MATMSVCPSVRNGILTSKMKSNPNGPTLVEKAIIQPNFGKLKLQRTKMCLTYLLNIVHNAKV
jgi:hypothetical protein